MKKACLLAALLSAFLPAAGAVIVDHRHTDLSRVPTEWIDQARAQLRVTYGHTSHGSQLMTGSWPSAGTQVPPINSPSPLGAMTHPFF
jgi:opacity protein-like surface antigen